MNISKNDLETNLIQGVNIDNIKTSKIDFGNEKDLNKYYLALGKFTFLFTKIKSACTWLYVSFLEEDDFTKSYNEYIEKPFTFILDELHKITHVIKTEVISHELLDELYTIDDIFKSYTGYNSAVVNYKDKEKLSLINQLIVGLDEINDELERVIPYVYYYVKKRLNSCGLNPDEVIDD